MHHPQCPAAGWSPASHCTCKLFEQKEIIVGLEKLTIEQLRDLAKKQMVERDKCWRNLCDWDDSIKETLSEFHRRVNQVKEPSDGRA
jgi:hypothetical protein